MFWIFSLALVASAWGLNGLDATPLRFAKTMISAAAFWAAVFLACLFIAMFVI